MPKISQRDEASTGHFYADFCIEKMCIFIKADIKQVMFKLISISLFIVL